MRSRCAGLAFAVCCVPALAVAWGRDGGAPPQSAASPATLEVVVHRWLEATGGERKSQKVQGVVVRADVSEDGIVGRVEERLDRDAWRRVRTEGARTREEACFGGAAWIRRNYVVRQLFGSLLNVRGRLRRGIDEQ